MVPPTEITPAAAGYQGREAFFAGKPVEMCPFEPGTTPWRAWTGAYEAARAFRSWLDEHLQREG